MIIISSIIVIIIIIIVIIILLLLLIIIIINEGRGLDEPSRGTFHVITAINQAINR